MNSHKWCTVFLFFLCRGFFSKRSFFLYLLCLSFGWFFFWLFYYFLSWLTCLFFIPFLKRLQAFSSFLALTLFRQVTFWCLPSRGDDNFFASCVVWCLVIVDGAWMSVTLSVYFTGKHNTWTLCLRLFIFLQRVSVVLFGHHQSEAQVCVSLHDQQLWLLQAK